MNDIIAALLSPAVGVAISPFPIVGLILILLSKRARIGSVFYSLGWIIGNAAVFAIAMIFMGQATKSSGDPGTIAKIVALILGLLLIAVAVSQFRKRPHGNEKAKTPGWFEKMSSIGPFGAAGFAIVLSALNPKNLLLGISAGVAVGQLSPSVSQSVAATSIFVAIASISIVVPTMAFLIAGKRVDKLLGNMRDWLIQNNAVIMAVLLFVIGLNIISKAL